VCGSRLEQALSDPSLARPLAADAEPESPAVRHFLPRPDGADASWLEMGSGPIVVLLHGFPDHARSFLPMMAKLADLGFRAVAVDLRGFGESAAPAGAVYDARASAEDVIAVLDAVQAREGGSSLSPLLIGHDLGGQVAWALATDYPARFSAAVVAASPHPALARANASPSQLVRSYYIAMFNLPIVATAMLSSQNCRLVGTAFAETRDWSDVAAVVQSSLFGSRDARPAAMPGKAPAGAIVSGEEASRAALARDPVVSVMSAGDVRALRREFSRPGRVAAALGWYHGLVSPATKARLASLALPWRGGTPVSLPLANLAAEHDMALGPELVAGTRRVAPRGASVIVQRASHWLHVERPGSLIAAALELVERSGSGGRLPKAAAAALRAGGEALLLGRPSLDELVRFADTGGGVLAPVHVPHGETADDVEQVRSALRAGLFGVFPV